MSAQPTPTPLPNDPGQPADTHGYREILHGLISMGTDFARLLHAQATVQPQPTQPAATPAPDAPAAPPAPAADTLISLAAAFDRTARAIRRSIALARSLAHPTQPTQDLAQHRVAARRRIIREVEDAIQRTSDPTDAATLQAELRDRLDTPDLDADITTRPVADIITELCRDLGLAALPGARPWKRRTPDDISQLHAHAAAPTPLRQPAAAPQHPRRDAPKRPPDPQPDKRAPMPRAQPGSLHAAIGPPGDPADRPMPHPTRAQARWRPPSAA